MRLQVDSGVDFRAHGFLYGHFRDRVPKSIREHPVRSLAVPGLASESDVRLAAAALSHVPVISLSDAHTAFCRFDGEDDNSAFEALVRELTWMSALATINRSKLLQMRSAFE